MAMEQGMDSSPSSRSFADQEFLDLWRCRQPMSGRSTTRADFVLIMRMIASDCVPT